MAKKDIYEERNESYEKINNDKPFIYGQNEEVNEWLRSVVEDPSKWMPGMTLADYMYNN